MSWRIAAELFRATRLARRGKILKATAVFQHTLQGMNTRAIRSGSRVLSKLGRMATRAHTTHRRAKSTAFPATALPHARAKVQPGRFAASTFTNEAGTRDYKVYIPALYDGTPLPLVVMLHGCKQNPDTFAAGTGMNDLADEQGFLVVYPMQTGSANLMHCWNWFQAEDQSRDQGEPSLIVGITRHVVQAFGLDPKRVYIAGLSAGGAMAAIMATTYPDVYSAVGIHSGLPYAAADDVASAFQAMRGGGAARAVQASRENDALRGVPTIVFHGDDDRTVHPSNGEQVIAQASPLQGTEVPVTAPPHAAAIIKGDAGGRSYTRTLFTDATGKCVTEHWVVHGGGHAWSGGRPSGSFTDPKGPEASREMVRFFLQAA